MNVWERLYREWLERPESPGVLDRIRKGQRAWLWGLTEGAQPMTVAMLARALEGRTLLVVVSNLRQAEQLARDVEWWRPGRPVLVLPPMEATPYRLTARSWDLLAPRLEVMTQLLEGEPPVVVAPVDALVRALEPPSVFRRYLLRLRPGDRLEPDGLARRLAEAGYERLERVDGPGQFAVRGDILDVAPPAGEAVRMEFFDDVVDSLRALDLESQRSLHPLEEVLLSPAWEVQASAAEREEAAGRAGGRLDEASRQELLGAGDPSRFLPLIHPVVGLEAYLTRGAITLALEPQRLQERLEGIHREWRERVAGLVEQGALLPGQEALVLEPSRVRPLWTERPGADLSGLAPASAGESRPVEIRSRGVPVFRGQLALLQQELERWRARRQRCLIVTEGSAQRQALAGELRNLGLEPLEAPDGQCELPDGAIRLLDGSLGAGFELPGLRLVVLTAGELRGRRPGLRRARPRYESVGQALARWEDLAPGDYVVHVQHGIGRFLGVQTMEVQGVHRDYMILEYEGGDRLYVPTQQIEAVQKYVGSEGRAPRLYRLGGNEWERVKERVRNSVREMADELLQLYAARQAVEGHAFAPDTTWQREFEESFPYEETEDQLRALEEIKRDMERPRPMDRLLCGDVGFGKTEVALRAAFKAVMDGKQVALLVPTTVLAQQHLVTFRRRLAGFPVRVEALSRFRSTAEQEAILTATRRGEVDILIGTHRLLQPDLAFKDLGLVIIDEEQRFGVEHKEFLKKLKSAVDVLTLTATPIPRTLHMSLAGIRDMSVIETPPAGRFPVETYVVEYDEALIREALERELARRGQVYYVHNRVQTIDQAYERVRRLVPEARVLVAHGQLSDERLEQVMSDFLEGRADVLVCSAIIENGLDIPRVNTLIVEEADRFGLAQLYQMRGRVGRSDRVAFAYFTYRKEKVLAETAQKRLEALKDFTELGSGFRIALRDLEIRGAGNILGAEQHGFIASVGFDLYAQMLEEAVRELRGERSVPATRATVELALDAYVPDGYVRDPRQKIELYKRVQRLERAAEVDELLEELVDRFGEPPEQVRNLLELARLRIAATEMGILALTQERRELHVQFAGFLEHLRPELQALVVPGVGRARVDGGGRVGFRIAIGAVSGRELLARVQRVLEAVAGLDGLRRWSRPPGTEATVTSG
ncbi:MAG: transcription-repair coupling factor [Clostridia bacterium]|nr:transcription-repair coupling factor [Clostridia bacterium]